MDGCLQKQAITVFSENTNGDISNETTVVTWSRLDETPRTALTYCMIFHDIAWYCMNYMILHDIAWYCRILQGIAWYCIVLHMPGILSIAWHSIHWYKLVSETLVHTNLCLEWDSLVVNVGFRCWKGFYGAIAHILLAAVQCCWK